jgi:hypothetical protein
MKKRLFFQFMGIQCCLPMLIKFGLLEARPTKAIPSIIIIVFSTYNPCK